MDSGAWKELAGWAWALLVVPLKMLWSKADNAATKQDLADSIRASKDASDEFRDTVRTLFKNAETDRANNSRTHMEMQDRINRTHVDLLGKLNGK